MKPYYESGGITIYHGDCREILPLRPANSVDLVLTDPPYGLEFMGKEWDKLARPKSGNLGGFATGDKPSFERVRRYLPAMQDWHCSWAVEALRVAKPGCHLLAFGGTRTHHRLMCGIEDAGWEIRDCLMWVYGSGFPKSLDVGKAIDKAAGARRRVVGHHSRDDLRKGKAGFRNLDGQNRDRGPIDLTAPATAAAKQWDGWGTALKPAWEPIILARKPLEGTVAENVQKWGTGALNIDGCRVDAKGETGINTHATARLSGSGWRMQALQTRDRCGRWPANLIHDGSEEIMELFAAAGADKGGGFPQERYTEKTRRIYGEFAGRVCPGGPRRMGKGSAARFFYCAKASRSERDAGLDGDKHPLLWSSGTKNPGSFQSKGTEKAAHNNHPTVKPLAVMRYLCRLACPPGGMILDLLMGSGSTLIAAQDLGFRAIGIEAEKGYCRIAANRLSAKSAPSAARVAV